MIFGHMARLRLATDAGLGVPSMIALMRARGALGAREAIPDLLRTFREDKGGWARASAARGLGALGAREAVPDLLRALREDGSVEVRKIAARALWRMADRGSDP